MTHFLNSRRLNEGSWQSFERIIARFLSHGGFDDVKVIGGSGDRGADIVGMIHDKRWVVQAKCYSSPVGTKPIDECCNALFAYKADIMAAVTNTKFTKKAGELANTFKNRGFDIRLWDNKNLQQMGENLPQVSHQRCDLRPYQKSAVNAVIDSINNGNTKALITLATGLGKTVVASEIISQYLADQPKTKVLVLAHVTELVRQLEQSCWPQFEKHIETQLWTDGEIPTYHDGVTFATWQSISSALSAGEDLLGAYQLIIVDECHHAPSEQFSSLLSALQPKFLLGLTATPWRGDGITLEHLFGKDPVFSMDVVEGMQRGYLAEVDYEMLVDGIDWDEIEELSREGLTIRDLNTRLYVPERDRGMIETITEKMSNLDAPRVLVFCRSIEHAQRLQHFFREWDVSAGIIHSEYNRVDRFITMSKFRAGETNVLISIEMLNEGIDVPEVNMVCFARITHSRRIFLQQLGRGLRMSGSKKKVAVLDFVADIRRIASAIEINTEAERYRAKEEVTYPNGEIVRFSSHSAGFFEQYLSDMANLSDLSETAKLKFPRI